MRESRFNSGNAWMPLLVFMLLTWLNPVLFATTFYYSVHANYLNQLPAKCGFGMGRETRPIQDAQF